MMKPIVFIVGPTASGKSEFALRLARKIDGEIVSCDSMHVYRGMNVGTAKPTREERRKTPHHLIDLISPRRSFSVFQYRQRALDAIRKIRARGKIPIIVGGSGLYVKSLLDGFSKHPGRQNGIRKQFESVAQRKGSRFLYERLKQVDPKRAEKVHPNDHKRIIRALEVWQRSGQAISDWESQSQPVRFQEHEYRIYGLRRERKELYERVERRVDQMFDAEWVREVKRLKRIGFSKTAREAIGYHEILKFLRGECSLMDAISETKKRTRHLVKKQTTWFRKDPRIQWIPVSGNRFAAAAVRKILNNLTTGERQT